MNMHESYFDVLLQLLTCALPLNVSHLCGVKQSSYLYLPG